MEKEKLPCGCEITFKDGQPRNLVPCQKHDGLYSPHKSTAQCLMDILYADLLEKHAPKPEPKTAEKPAAK